MASPAICCITPQGGTGRGLPTQPTGKDREPVTKVAAAAAQPSPPGRGVRWPSKASHGDRGADKAVPAHPTVSH